MAKKKIKSEDKFCLNFFHKTPRFLYNLSVHFVNGNPVEIIDIEVNRNNKKITLGRFVDSIGTNKLMVILQGEFKKSGLLKSKGFIFSADLQLSQ